MIIHPKVHPPLLLLQILLLHSSRLIQLRNTNQLITINQPSFIISYGDFLTWGYPQIMYFRGIFPYKPTILRIPPFIETPRLVPPHGYGYNFATINRKGSAAPSANTDVPSFARWTSSPCKPTDKALPHGRKGVKLKHGEHMQYGICMCIYIYIMCVDV